MFDTAIKGKWDIGNNVVLTPTLRAVYFKETVEDYSVSDGTGAIGIDGHSQEQLRVIAWLQVEKTLKLPIGAAIGCTCRVADIDALFRHSDLVEVPRQLIQSAAHLRPFQSGAVSRDHELGFEIGQHLHG